MLSANPSPIRSSPSTSHQRNGLLLEWRDVRCIVKDGKAWARKTKTILNGVSGRARPGRVLAIMGPSGSGKTTLLNSLAAQMEKAPGLLLQGEVYVNGEICNHSMAKMRKGFVRQEDTFYSQMTVRETLRFVACLRLSPEVPYADKMSLVESLINKFSLGKCADTIVGDTAVGARRGISGGEKKRLSIACELIGDPKLIFLDEPTTGLDSFQALRVMESLKELAADGCTVVCVVHQPSSAVFLCFHDLLIMSEGSVAYHGLADSAMSYFAHHGETCPPNVSAAEHCLNVVSVDMDSSLTEKDCRERIKRLTSYAVKTAKRSLFPAGAGAGGGGADLVVMERSRPEASLVEQCSLLLGRSWRQVSRNRVANGIRLAQQVGVAAVYGGIYSLSDAQCSIQDRLGLLQMVAIGSFVQPLAAAIRTFPREKSIVASDRSKHLYNVFPYFLSKVATELPVTLALSCVFSGILYPSVRLQPDWAKFKNFVSVSTLHSLASQSLGMLISSVASSSDAAIAMMPPVIVACNLFNGFVVTEESLSFPFSWLPRLSVIRWAWEGLMLNEFDGLKFVVGDEAARGVAVATGREALARISTIFEKSTIKGVLLAQGAILASCYWQTYFALCRTNHRFATMDAPSFIEDEGTPRGNDSPLPPGVSAAVK